MAASGPTRRSGNRARSAARAAKPRPSPPTASVSVAATNALAPGIRRRRTAPPTVQPARNASCSRSRLAPGLPARSARKAPAARRVSYARPNAPSPRRQKARSPARPPPQHRRARQWRPPRSSGSRRRRARLRHVGLPARGSSRPADRRRAQSWRHSRSDPARSAAHRTSRRPEMSSPVQNRRRRGTHVGQAL